MKSFVVMSGLLFRGAAIFLLGVLVMVVAFSLIRSLFPGPTGPGPVATPMLGNTQTTVTVTVGGPPPQANATVAPAPLVNAPVAAQPPYPVNMAKGTIGSVGAGCVISGDIEPNGDSHWHDVTKDGTVALITQFTAPVMVAAPYAASGVCGLDQAGMAQQTAQIRQEKLQTEHFQQVVVKVYSG